MSRLELAGRVRDTCAGILFRKGHEEAARSLFLQPAPVLLQIAEGARKPRLRRRTAPERHAAELLTALRDMAGRAGVS